LEPCWGLTPVITVGLTAGVKAQRPESRSQIYLRTP
jgi:hypothetical protein